MAATLKIIDNMEVTIGGVTFRIQQGASGTNVKTADEVSVTGQCHYVASTLATATVITVWDDDNDFPIDFQYLKYKADQDSYIQIVGSATNAIFKVEANKVFSLSGFDTILAAADTTIITGGTEPTLTDIDNITIGNYSGETMNYQFMLVN